MKNVFIFARLELKTAGRERSAQALLAVFLGMVLVSSFIGWSAHHTVMSIYDETLRQTGHHLANPFAGASPLEPVKNTVIYIVLIGALLAIISGVRSSVRDRRAHVVDLILTRPLTAPSFVAGKLLGVHGWLGLVLAAASLLSWISVWVVAGRPLSLAYSGYLAVFFVLAWLFLLPFTALGLVAGARSRHEANALLAPILFWVALTFVVPQLGTAENPSALLNPVTARPVSTGPLFQANRLLLQPLSLTEHFKHASSLLLRLPNAGAGSAWADLAVLLLGVSLGLAALTLVTRAALRRPLYE